MAGHTRTLLDRASGRAYGAKCRHFWSSTEAWRAMMEFGIFDHVERKDGMPITETYRERWELASLADQAGCYCYHISEHHGTPLSTAPSPNLMAVALAMRTQRLRVGPLGALLPLYEPLRLVEEICMLDQLSEGRLELGLGRGVSRLEVKFYNVDAE